MKKYLSLLLAVVMSFSVMYIYNLSANASMLCDVNSDSLVNAKDVLYLRKNLAKIDVKIDLQAADINSDGNVNSKDVLMLRKILVGLVSMTTSTIETTEKTLYNTTSQPISINILPPTIPTVLPTSSVMTVQTQSTESSSSKLIALTFDDGPNIYSTPQILTALRVNKVKATFFLIGKNINDLSADIIKDQLAQECEIANHSYSHAGMNVMDAESIKSEIERTDELIMKYANVQTKYFRAPMLRQSQLMYDSIDKTFIAGRCPNDWDDSVTIDDCENYLHENVNDGTIILLHDSQAKNSELLFRIIPYYKNLGYEFVTLSELFERKGVTPVKNVTYSAVIN